MMKKFKLLYLSLLLCFSVSAQTAIDALNFGQYYHGGTARYMGMSGAFNALGGDFSTLSVNPAGIGIYRSDEFTVSVDWQFNKTRTGITANTSQWVGNALSGRDIYMSQRESDFNLNNLGYVMTEKLGNSGLVSHNFGVGINKLKNFNKSYRAEAIDAMHSLTDSWSQVLDGATIGAKVADDAYLMNRINNGSGIELQSPLIEGVKTDYIKDVKEDGSLSEWVLSYGGNINNTVFFGVTLGIQDIEMVKEYYQTEYFLNTSHVDTFYNNKSYVRYFNNGMQESAFKATDADNFTYYSSEHTSGVGINGKFGVLVKPIDVLSIGFAVHTPTINSFIVSHYADLTNNTIYYTDKDELVVPGENGDGPGEGLVPPSSYNYRTVSPYKLHASLGLILGGRAAIDVEADMVDYSTMKIKSLRRDNYDYSATNTAISKMYKVAFNVRAGAEVKIVPALFLRAGAVYYGSPYRNNFYEGNGVVIDAADYVGGRFEHSIGLGYKAGDFFLDFAYIRAMQKSTAFVFDDAITATEFYEMEMNNTYNRFMLTLGLKF